MSSLKSRTLRLSRLFDRKAEKLLQADLTHLSRDFTKVQAYCMFVCHARSGHSLFGSLLDAHPNMIVAHEFNTLEFVRRGLNRDQLFFGLLQQSRQFTESGRTWNRYVYKVPDQWHGRYDKLRVIGDKMGSVSAAALARDGQLLPRLRKIAQAPVKIFRVIRNPFDNIATLSLYHYRENLDATIERYFFLCAAIKKIQRNHPPQDWLDIRHEDLIAQPRKILRASCGFLGVTAHRHYLDCCASIVFESPRRRRRSITWSPAQRRKVENKIRQYDHLAGYSFDS
jgi:hypothetical protein